MRTADKVEDKVYETIDQAAHADQLAAEAEANSDESERAVLFALSDLVREGTVGLVRVNGVACYFHKEVTN